MMASSQMEMKDKQLKGKRKSTHPIGNHSLDAVMSWRGKESQIYGGVKKKKKNHTRRACLSVHTPIHGKL